LNWAGKQRLRPRVAVWRSEEVVLSKRFGPVDVVWFSPAEKHWHGANKKQP
jgi:hypothetical protein